MGTYIVTFTATYTTEVEAADEDEAREKAETTVNHEAAEAIGYFIHTDDIIDVEEAD